MIKNYLLLTASALMLMTQALSADQYAGRVTEYYTMVNTHKIRRHCSTEGNQIVRGQLYGSDCRPVKKYCKWGIGARNTCIRPCLDAAGGRAFKFGSIVKVRPRKCQWGPYKGKIITQVRIVDVGGAVKRNHVDVFQGLCRREVGGVCREFEPDDSMVAEYNGRGREYEMARLAPPFALDYSQTAASR
jgi:hypothetical protein